MQTLRHHRFILWTGRLTGGLLAGIFLIFILAQMVLFTSIHWINSEQGSIWLNSQLSETFQGSGYQVMLGDLHYWPFSRLFIEELRITRHQENYVHIQDLTLGVRFLPLAAKSISAFIAIDQVKLYEAKSIEKTETEGIGFTSLPEFNLPELYFNSLAINRLVIDNLILAGPGLQTGVEMAAITRLENNIISLDLEALLNAHSQKPMLPQRFLLKAALNTQTGQLTLRRARALSADYQIATSGDVILNKKGRWNLTAQAKSHNTEAILSEPGSLNATAKIQGPYSTPNFQAQGSLILSRLQQRGLSPIEFQLKAQDPLKRLVMKLDVQTTYQGQKVALETTAAKRNKIYRLDPLRLDAPKVAISGAVETSPGATFLRGSLEANISSLSPYAELLDIPLAGRGKAQLTLLEKENQQSLKLGTDLTDIRYQNFRAERAKLNIHTPNIRTPLRSAFSLDLTKALAEDLRLESAEINVETDPNAKGALSFQTEAFYQDIPVNLQGQASLSHLNSVKEISAENIQVRLRSRQNTVQLSGNIHPQRLDLSLDTDAFDLQTIASLLPGNIRNLQTTGIMRLNGPLSKPTARLDGTLFPKGADKIPEFTLHYSGTYENSQATFSVNGKGGPINALKGSFFAPFDFKLQPPTFDLNTTTPLSGKIMADLHTKFWADQFLPPGNDFTGIMTLQTDLSGTLGTPKIRGSGQLSDSSFLNSRTGLEMRNIAAEVTFDHQQVQIARLTAQDAQEGRLSASGYLSLEKPEYPVDLSINATSFSLQGSERLAGEISADLTMKGQKNNYHLSGETIVNRLSINIPERFTTSIPRLNIIKKESAQPSLRENHLLQMIALDVEVKIDDQLFVRGWGLDAELGGELDITGTTARPKINGSLNLLRGRYEEFGRRFDIEEAFLRFEGDVPPSPFLDVTATTDLKDTTARILINGTIMNPSLSFTSSPPLGEDQVLSRILFGKDLGSITPFQAVQLTNTLRRFSGQGSRSGLNPVEQLRTATGLDDLQIELNGSGGPTVGFGKYLSEDVYLELEQGATAGSGEANLQIELNPHLTLNSEIGQDAEAGGGIFWKYDY